MRLKLFALFLVVSSFPIRGADVPVFKTPEELMHAFAERMGEGDYGGAMELFDYEQRVANYDFVRMAERLKSLNFMVMAPSDYPGMAALNRAQQMNAASRQLLMFVYSMLLPEEFHPLLSMKPLVAQDDAAEKATRLVEAIHPDNLRGLKVAKMFLVKPDIQNSERYLENVKRNAAIFGFSDAKEYMVFYGLGDETYVGAVSVSRYDGWRIAGLYSNLAGTPSVGGVMKVEGEGVDLEKLHQELGQ